MKAVLKVFKIFLFTIALINLLSFNSFAVEDAIIAIVNNELITLKDLKDYIHATYINMMTQGASEEEIKQTMEALQKDGIHNLIEDKLILSKANEMKLAVNEKAINQRMEEVKKRYPSEEIFLNALVQNLATMTELKNKITDQLKIQYVIEEEVRNKIFVNPEEVTTFYLENQDKFKKEARVNVQSIFLSFDKRTKDQAQELSKTVLARIKNGEKFEDISKEISDAPSIGIVEKGAFLPQVEKILFNLNINKVSEPIEVATGIYLFKVIGKKPAQVATINDVKNDIQELLYKMKFREKLNAWIEKLKKEAFIEIKK